ncbi:MAG TPA: glutamyl-tRNA reductase [Bryobacteraceae bacterium]|jgi:glutamyl-tRNA reductase|nr:glutamyl-tRNA reductase [Bryobacteraceae bacterium]
MKLLLAGLSHKTAPVHMREKMAIPESALPDALRGLQNLGASEAMILSTCNRVEIAVTTADGLEPGDIVDRFLNAWQGSATAFAGHLYRLEAREAIQHTFRVASSLDSMVVGEPQVLGQLKNAYAVAKTEGAVGGLLEQVLTQAFRVAKRVRTETGIGQMAVSVSYAAVELARNIFNRSLKGHSVLIIGSGKMGELAARHLHRSGATRIFVTNRTWERAQEMAAVFQGRAVDYKEFPAMLHEVDIVIASSGAPHYILSREDMRRVIALRKNKPMFLIDIAVPRNIDPAASDVDGVFLYSVDDLEGVVNANLQERSKQAEQAEVIVVDEVERMLSRLKLDEVTPTIISLQEQLESIRLAEVARALRRMPQLDPEHRRLVEAQVEAMTKSIINKIAHLPISALRTTAGQPDGDQFLDAVRKVFHLQD